jgi:hypothetical protein
MANGFMVAIGICGALTGSIAVSVLATKDLPREETAPVVEEGSAPGRRSSAAPRRATAPPAARPQEITPYPLPRPLDRGR